MIQRAIFWAKLDTGDFLVWDMEGVTFRQVFKAFKFMCRACECAGCLYKGTVIIRRTGVSEGR